MSSEEEKYRLLAGWKAICPKPHFEHRRNTAHEVHRSEAGSARSSESSIHYSGKCGKLGASAFYTYDHLSDHRHTSHEPSFHESIRDYQLTDSRFEHQHQNVKDKRRYKSVPRRTHHSQTMPDVTVQGGSEVDIQYKKKSRNISKNRMPQSNRHNFTERNENAVEPNLHRHTHLNTGQIVTGDDHLIGCGERNQFCMSAYSEYGRGGDVKECPWPYEHEEHTKPPHYWQQNMQRTSEGDFSSDTNSPISGLSEQSICKPILSPDKVSSKRKPHRKMIDISINNDHPSASDILRWDASQQVILRDPLERTPYQMSRKDPLDVNIFPQESEAQLSQESYDSHNGFAQDSGIQDGPEIQSNSIHNQQPWNILPENSWTIPQNIQENVDYSTPLNNSRLKQSKKCVNIDESRKHRKKNSETQVNRQEVEAMLNTYGDQEYPNEVDMSFHNVEQGNMYENMSECGDHHLDLYNRYFTQNTDEDIQCNTFFNNIQDTPYNTVLNNEHCLKKKSRNFPLNVDISACNGFSNPSTKTRQLDVGQEPSCDIHMQHTPDSRTEIVCRDTMGSSLHRCENLLSFQNQTVFPINETCQEITSNNVLQEEIEEEANSENEYNEPFMKNVEQQTSLTMIHITDSIRQLQDRLKEKSQFENCLDYPCSNCHRILSEAALITDACQKIISQETGTEEDWRNDRRQQPKPDKATVTCRTICQQLQSIETTILLFPFDLVYSFVHYIILNAMKSLLLQDVLGIWKSENEEQQVFLSESTEDFNVNEQESLEITVMDTSAELYNELKNSVNDICDITRGIKASTENILGTITNLNKFPLSNALENDANKLQTLAEEKEMKELQMQEEEYQKNLEFLESVTEMMNQTNYIANTRHYYRATRPVLSTRMVENYNILPSNDYSVDAGINKDKSERVEVASCSSEQESIQISADTPVSEGDTNRPSDGLLISKSKKLTKSKLMTTENLPQTSTTKSKTKIDNPPAEKKVSFRTRKPSKPSSGKEAKLPSCTKSKPEKSDTGRSSPTINKMDDETRILITSTSPFKNHKEIYNHVDLSLLKHLQPFMKDAATMTSCEELGPCNFCSYFSRKKARFAMEDKATMTSMEDFERTNKINETNWMLIEAVS